MATSYTYGKDILEDVLERAGELTTQIGTTSDYLDSAQRYVNRAYYSLLSIGFPWPFAKKHPPGIINTAAEETGTASITNGNTSLTLDASIASSMEGWKIYFDDDGVIYRVTSHTAGSTAVTIDATLKETTKSSANYTMFQDEFDLASDCLLPLRFWFRNQPEHKIERENAATMFSRKPTSSIRPSKWAYINDQKIRFNRWTEDAQTIEYDYVYAPGFLDFTGSGSGDTPIIPIQHRHILAEWALVMLLEDKNDPRAEQSRRDLNANVSLLKAQYANLLQPNFRPRRGQSISPRG